MADTFSNDLRVRLQESGSNAGTWGDLLNGTITNIASALGQGSEAIPNASTHTITLADGTADEARSLYLKCTGGGQACTVTLGPNTISKVWIIDNATSYTLTFSQGSGANVAIAAGAVKVIATDGAGSGAAVVDTLDGLEGSLKTLAVNSGATTETTAAAIGYNGDVGTNLYINTDHGNNLVSLYASGDVSKEMRFMSGTLEVMRLGTTGNVGVGTSAPASLLDVSSTGEVISTVRSTSTSGARQATLRLNVPSTGGDDPAGRVQFTYGTGYTVAGSIEMSHTNPAMKFLTGTTEVMRISGSNVGIGTGANAISHQLVSYKSGANSNYVQIASGSTGLGATNGLRLGVSSAGIGEIYSQSASPVMTFNANNVGIGTSTPDTTLHLQTPSGTKSEINFAQTAVTNYRIGVPASTDALVFTYGASTERMRILADGSVAIGTTALPTGIGGVAPQMVLKQGSTNSSGIMVETSATDSIIRMFHNGSAGILSTSYGSTGSFTPLQFETSGVERLRIAANGSISIPNQNAINELSFTGTEFTNVLSATTSGFNFGTTGAGYLAFITNNSEKARIDSVGDLSVGTTSSGHRLYVEDAVNATQGTAQFRIGGSGYSAFHFLDANAYYIGQNSQSRFLRIYSGANAGIGVSLSPQSTSWGTYSDERLKENIEPIESAIESLLGLRTVKYHLKDVDSAESKKRLGLIAQDLIGVLDEVIEPTTQAKDDTEYLSVRYTEIIPVLVKGIQEQQATIESQAAAITDLTTRLTALENN